ncbi:unnamed protein product [Paramecium octaurelia]|uniref:G domain-containing protein n=1 Tax=Paramecium octaurelia TaxID=43137 RepID=A0A8S1TZ13_PAROT|nr:unnamed protein product [Paramecium octaurelia]
MNKFKKNAHQLIVQKEIDETEKLQKYLSNEQRKKMWINLNKTVGSEEVNNFIRNASQKLSDGLFYVFKDFQYKQYSTSQIQEIQKNIEILYNFSLILQRFLEGDVDILYQVMVLVPKLNENYMKTVQRIYIFFLEYKIQLDGYLQMENSLFQANSNLKVCLDYLYLKYQFLEQLKQVEEKKNLLELEKYQMKVDKSKMEDTIKINEDTLNSLRELFAQNQDDIQNQIKLIKDQHLQEITNISNDKIKVEQIISELQDQYTDIQYNFTQLQNVKTQQAMELSLVRNLQNQMLIESQNKEQTIKSQSDQAINQIENLKKELLEQQLKNQKISEYCQDLQILNEQMRSEFNQLQVKYTIAEYQRSQLFEECKKNKVEIKKKTDEIVKLQNEKKTTDLVGQVSQCNHVSLISLQQQCDKVENQLKLLPINNEPNYLEKNNLDPVVVLIGITDSGKTTLFNKICKSQEQVDAAKSTTKQSILGQSAYGQGFQVIDTPGLATLQNKIQQAVGILNAVSYQPLNKIFFILKFEKLQLMVNQLFKQIFIFHRYRKLFIAVITHFDKSQEKQQDQQKILQEMKKYGIEQVLFFSNQDSGQEICNQIHIKLINTISIQVEITDVEFLNNFDLLEDPEMAEDLFKFYEELFSISSMIIK